MPRELRRKLYKFGTSAPLRIQIARRIMLLQNRFGFAVHVTSDIQWYLPSGSLISRQSHASRHIVVNQQQRTASAAAMSSLVCDVCGSSRMEEDDSGHMACLDCGTQSQQLFAESNEAADMGNGDFIRSIRRPKVAATSAVMCVSRRCIDAVGVIGRCRGQSLCSWSTSPR